MNKIPFPKYPGGQGSTLKAKIFPSDSKQTPIITTHCRFLAAGGTLPNSRFYSQMSIICRKNPNNHGILGTLHIDKSASIVYNVVNG